MKKTIYPAAISGTLRAPASKSYAQRALAAALLAHGTTVLHNPSRCNDALSAMQVIKNLGATITDRGDSLVIDGGLASESLNLDFGEAGLGIRLFASIAALCDGEITLTGSGSLLKRPMSLIDEALTALGVTCKTTAGHLPIIIKGPVRGGEITIDGSLSSQVLSGLIMALPLAGKDSMIHVSNLNSTPYVDMTMEVMRDFGIEISHSNYEEFRIRGGQTYQPSEYTVEGDWSGAAFLLVAGAISGRVKIEELNPDSLQADRQILSALYQTGARVEIAGNTVICEKDKLQAFSFDARHCPDLFPPLVSLAAHCHGQSTISGVHRLIHKESNRADALITEMGKLGVQIKTEGDEMIITGQADIRSATIDSRNDHRIAMAAATVILPGDYPAGINKAECVNKSYPDFYKDLKQLGGKIDE
ncbi:MAG: 3-phosphoshikimate 1-carboxyvinyltransferase [Bacteroidales bacterium]|nr:3-phosphoshikimate 1-carboxyvinyltransferase [Bacteroidales bacterium]